MKKLINNEFNCLKIALIIALVTYVLPFFNYLSFGSTIASVKEVVTRVNFTGYQTINVIGVNDILDVIGIAIVELIVINAFKLIYGVICIKKQTCNKLSSMLLMISSFITFLCSVFLIRNIYEIGQWIVGDNTYTL